MRSTASQIISEGFPLSDLLCKLHDEVIRKEDLSDLDKALICEKIAQVHIIIIIINLYIFSSFFKDFIYLLIHFFIYMIFLIIIIIIG